MAISTSLWAECCGWGAGVLWSGEAAGSGVDGWLSAVFMLLCEWLGAWPGCCPWCMCSSGCSWLACAPGESWILLWQQGRASSSVEWLEGYASVARMAPT